jgi:hypothetical protein
VPSVTASFFQVSSIKRAGTLPHLRGSQKRLEQAALDLESEEKLYSAEQSKKLTKNAGTVSARDLVHPSTKLEPLNLSDSASGTGSYSASHAGNTMPMLQGRSRGKRKGKANGRKENQKNIGIVSTSQSARASLGSGNGVAAQRPPPGPKQSRSAPNRARKLVGAGSVDPANRSKQEKNGKGLATKQLLFQNGMKIDGFFVTMSVYGVATGLELVVYEPNSAET